jgi:hypothetical protein
MKGKTAWISLLMILMLIGGIPAVLGASWVAGDLETVKVWAQDASDPTAAPVLYGDGQKYVELNDTYDLTDSFTVWLNVTDVTLLRLYGAGVSWDSSILSLDTYGEGEFFYRAPVEYRTSPVNQPVLATGAGYIDQYASVSWALKKPGNVSGTGTLAWFDFDVVGWGVTLIDITIGGAAGTVLQDPADTDIDWNSYDIVFDNTGLIPVPFDPTADFTVTPPAPYYAGQTLTFTAKNTSSEWGYAYPNWYPIVLVEWDFGDGNYSAPSGSLVETNTYVTDGTFDVNCTVYDGRGWNDSKIVSITVFPLAVGAVLDVMTQQAPFNGSGPYFPSSPFRANKEEEVCLYAKLVYNDCPVANKIVTFAVYQHTPPPLDPYALDFTQHLVRTAFTNASGWASVCYRIPTGLGEEFHGGYLVYAYAFIATNITSDATIYHVEWVNEIINVQVDPLGTGPWAQGDTACFNITIQSWDYVAHPLVVSLTLYDDLDVVIASVTCGPVGRPPVQGFPPGWTCDWWSDTRLFYGDGTYLGLIMDLYIAPAYSWIIICVDIPSYAYVGVGTAYINLFDAWPMPDLFAEPLGLMGEGQPWSPEASEIFAIECAT